MYIQKERATEAALSISIEQKFKSFYLEPQLHNQL